MLPRFILKRGFFYRTGNSIPERKSLLLTENAIDFFLRNRYNQLT